MDGNLGEAERASGAGTEEEETSVVAVEGEHPVVASSYSLLLCGGRDEADHRVEAALKVLDPGKGSAFRCDDSEVAKGCFQCSRDSSAGENGVHRLSLSQAYRCGFSL